ncbi:FMN-binding negative transcriptional regulator [Photobacterium galatheae]|uniref:FMN-binding negative transcriptional regulator n=1 Tax=Photobacterium galatheae TaxID=1654360 RepID=UPI00202CA9A9|nr:FMN-binding negative transcriptional regulator [Photobacterium galatheae]MCM0148660.1 FMN-binding negative transcriptional regulator [Photobacterium galatheae]
MYIPKNMIMRDKSAISAFISEHSFGLLVSSNLNATHLPFVFEENEAEMGVLYGHFAKANNHWKALENERVLIVFNGPHAYISPTWYHHTPAVPTWNYAAVHCYGTVQLLDDAQTEQHLQTLITQHEAELHENKNIMPDEFRHKLKQAIVGFKIVIDEIQAKDKLGQHRKPEDQQGVYLALNESQNPDANALAGYMKKRETGLGDS